jgi:ABC-type nitrate/sulfonate/bicarbonate transport system ATPase subunit
MKVGQLFLDLVEGSGRTVLLVTHDVEEAVLLSDRILVMTNPPSTVGSVVKVELPRPRDYIQSRFDPLFHQLQEEVWALLGVRTARGN